MNVNYSIWFNRRHQRSGHLFQGRFKSVALDREEWGLALSRYVHLNPVRIQTLGLGRADRQAQRVGLSPASSAAEVRKRVARLREYRWSSYRAYLGLRPGPEWLECRTVLGLGGGSKGQQRLRYREYGDTGRDLTLWLGRRVCGLKLGERVRAVDSPNDGVVATNVRRYALRLERDRPENARMQEVLKVLNCEM